VASQLRAAGLDQLNGGELMFNCKPLPSREYVLQHLRYEPETGIFYWLESGKGRPKSLIAGSKKYCDRTGVPKTIAIHLGGTIYNAHRLAWLVITGQDPGEMTIDHCNRNPFDNRPCNLRLADRSLQSRNRNAYGVSKHKGVSLDRRRQRWTAHCWRDEKPVWLGSFKTEAEAAAVAAPYHIP
jgi:hypothetical protein